ncbi:MAG TPA: hypothetical protein PLZ43_13795 [bacterium]|nr:hypothetical protein [bacterium]
MTISVEKNAVRLALSLAAPQVTSDFAGTPLVLVDVADLPLSTIATGTDILYTVLSIESWDLIALQALNAGNNSTSDSYLAVKNLFDQIALSGAKVSKVLIGVNRSTTWLATFNAVWALTQDFILCIGGVDDGGTSGTITDLLATAKRVEAVGRVYCGTTRDAASLTADSGSATLGSKAKADSVNSFLQISDNDAAFEVSCILGKILPDFIPSLNPCYKALKEAEGLNVTDAEFAFAQAKRLNIILNDGEDPVLIPFNGVASAGGHYGGICSNGEFLDREIAKAYMNIEIPRRFYNNYMKREQKIDFNTIGSQEVTAKLIEIITQIGITEPPRPFIEPDFTVFVPDMSSADYSSAKKSQRHLDGVTGDGEITGAVNVVNIALNFI